LYHQTTAEKAKGIPTSGVEEKGIHFFFFPQETNRGGDESGGVILRCKVYLGNYKKLNDGDLEKTSHAQLQSEGIDSVCIARQTENEYVVWNWDQVHVLPESEPHLPAVCRFEYIPYSTKVRTTVDAFEASWDWLKQVSREKRTSDGVGPGARYFKVVSRGPELFAIHDNQFYYHDNDKWIPFKSVKPLFIDGKEWTETKKE